MNNKVILNVRKYFPSSWSKWKDYLKTSILVILAAMVYALNSFVDNFMCTTISGGNQSLAYANTWTEIEIGIISLTTIVGSSIFAQYVGKGDIQKIREVVSFRILFALLIALLFAIPAMIVPSRMVELISGFDSEMSKVVKNNAESYLRVIAIGWIINAISFTLAMVLREKHHGIASFIASLISLIVNIVLNSIFIFGLDLEIYYLAISTIISLAISSGYVIIFISMKDRSLLVNPLKMFKISKTILMQFGKRTPSFLLLTFGSLTVTLRVMLWNWGYPTGTVGDPIYKLSAAAILGISAMFFNIFWTTFESINANIAIYVGRELGHDNFEVAKNNANELQGFHVTIASIMAIALFIVTWIIRVSPFISRGFEEQVIEYWKENNTLGYSPEQINEIAKKAGESLLKNIQYNLFPLCVMMPLFIWFITRNRVISAGGFTNLVSVIELLTGTAQLGWIAMLCFVIKSPDGKQLPFSTTYSLFFITDMIKCIIYEIVFRKVQWMKNITKEEY